MPFRTVRWWRAGLPDTITSSHLQGSPGQAKRPEASGNARDIYPAGRNQRRLKVISIHLRHRRTGGQSPMVTVGQLGAMLMGVAA